MLSVNQVQAYPKGTTLFAPGDFASAVYFILNGTVIASQGGEQVNLGGGGIIGDVAFLKESTYTYTAICATNVTALKITENNISKVFADQPRIACALLREVATRIEDVDQFRFFQGVEEPKKLETEPESVPESKPEKTLEHKGSPVIKGILPEGHPIYEGRMAPEHNEFLFSTEGQCPICQTKFTAFRTRGSRLQLEEQRPDFRSIYRNFEPNFYYLWVCPCCHFTYPEKLFAKLPPLVLRRAKNAWANREPAEVFEFDPVRTIHQVICSYYLAMSTFEAIGAIPDLWANLWLRLLWIYEDLGDEERALHAAGKARDYFVAAMAQTARSVSGDQQLYIILGELNLRLGNDGEAFRSFHSAAMMPGGDPRHKRLATDRIQDLRTR